ncbi:hypothetical protein WA026_001711 [Henosepilachna vigintioctopunctata]|uniref:Uncharacterized protein n=1 Tax=Henosepilachna vigintioctopunctata TaxID=420089 RepID=A0AAW1UU90_9CUCU
MKKLCLLLYYGRFSALSNSFSTLTLTNREETITNEILIKSSGTIRLFFDIVEAYSNFQISFHSKYFIEPHSLILFSAFFQSVFNFADHSVPTNGTSSHLTSSWNDYPQYTSYSSQSGYYESHQEILPTPGHLPTVLPEVPSQHEYITTSLTSPLISPTPMYNSAKPDLEAIMPSNPRYSDNPYCPNNWTSPNPTYPQTYAYDSPTSNQQYSPVVAIYPHLYSTVNQNQIHVHVHGSSENLDKFFTSAEALSGATPRAIELASVPSTDVVPPVAGSLQESEREQPNDPNVWRPY